MLPQTVGLHTDDLGGDKTYCNKAEIRPRVYLTRVNLYWSVNQTDWLRLVPLNRTGGPWITR